MHNLTDEELAQLAFTQKEYFDILVHRYVDKIQRYVARVIGNWQESEDITQDVFLKAYENIASFNTKLKFSSWLYRIAHNESVNFIKKHYRYKKVEFNDQLKNTLIEDCDNLEDIIKKEDSKKIKFALEQMKPADREILELFYWEDKSYIEIADILQMPINSVGATISRAKKKIKKIVLEKYE